MYVKRISLFFIGLLMTCQISYASYVEPLVNIQHWETINGVKVYFVAATQIPIVDVQLMFHAGSAYDGKSPGLAALTNAMLDEGTKKLSTNQIATNFENVGSVFQNGVSRDFAFLKFRSLSDKQYLQPTAEVFSDIVSHPSFPTHELSRLRQQTLMGLKMQDQQPGAIANKTFLKALYGSSPYAHPSIGNARSVKGLKVAHLKSFYQQYYVAKNATLILVGNLSRKNAEALADQITQHLPAGKQAALKWQSPATDHALLKKVTFPSAQTHVLMGQIGIKKGSPHFFATRVGNHILGGPGNMTSRLFDEVRDKKGLVYNVSSAFASMKEAGPFYIYLQTRNKETNNAISTVRETLDGYLKSGPSRAELNMAKQNIILSFPMTIASNQAILGVVADIAAYQLPLDFIDTYREHIRAVTSEDIKQTFQTLIHPDKFVTVTVGSTTS